MKCTCEHCNGTGKIPCLECDGLGTYEGGNETITLELTADVAGQPLGAAICSALASCPFCGLTDKDTVSPDMGLVPAVAMHGYPQGYRVECEGCCCTGPWQHQHGEAIVAWNRRPNAKLTNPAAE